jgi:hypothetical protein
MRVEGREVELAIDAQGLRGHERPAAQGEWRVLGLGDSFAFGFGVAEEESYLARMEALLAPSRVVVVNAGHIGFGPDNEARFLESEGASLRPRLVLVGFYVGNDLWNVLTGPDRAIVVDGVLVSRPGIRERWDRPLRPGRILSTSLASAPPSDEPSAWRRLLRRSHAYRFLSRRWAALRAGSKADGPRPLTLLDDEAVFIREDPPEFVDGWARVRELLARMDAWCRAHRAALAVAVIPTASQVDPGRWAAARLRHGLRDGDFDLGKPQRILLEFGRDSGVAVIDLLPVLKRAAAEPGGPLYFPRDAHWTPRGHDVAARALVDELRGRELLP